MAKITIKKSSQDVTVYLFIQDSSVTTGAGKTGLAYNTASLVCYYVRPLAAAAALSLATQTVTGAHVDGGFVEVDATNMPGIYRLDLSDAVCLTGVPSVVVMLKGASGMAPVTLEIQLTDFDLNDATPDVNVAEISNDATAADNLEAAFDGNTYNVGGGAIVAESVTGAVGSVTGAVGSVTGNVGGNVTGSVGSVVGAVGSVATGGITAASIATNAIDADSLAADAVTEIQAGLATSASIAALNNLSAAQVNAEVVDALATDVIADSVAADGSRPTIAQALLMITRFLTEKSVSSTTVTVNKEDGTTASMTFTLDSATAPTAITRAT